MLPHINTNEPGLFVITAASSELPETPEGRQPHPRAFKANVLCKGGTVWEEHWCIRVLGIEDLVQLVTGSEYNWIISTNYLDDVPLPEIEISNDYRE